MWRCHESPMQTPSPLLVLWRTNTNNIHNRVYQEWQRSVTFDQSRVWKAMHFTALSSGRCCWSRGICSTWRAVIKYVLIFCLNLGLDIVQQVAKIWQSSDQTAWHYDKSDCNEIFFSSFLFVMWGSEGKLGVDILPANIIMCWKGPPILCLRPRLIRKDRG